RMTGLSRTVDEAGKVLASTAIWFDGGSADLFNHGYIYGDAEGVAVRFSDGGNRLRNHGTIFNLGADAIIGGDGVDTVINRGLIVGDIRLGSGDDRFTAPNLVADSTVYGEDGNDTLIGSQDDSNFLVGGL